MSYEPTNWKTGDVVTSQKLNKLEQGVAGAGGVMVVHNVDGTLDKTWKEIHDAIDNGTLPLLSWASDGEAALLPISVAWRSTEEKYIYVVNVYRNSEVDGQESGGTMYGCLYNYLTNAETGYPVLTEL